MTQNQIAYAQHLENARHNIQTEVLGEKTFEESARHNITTERETKRSNLAKELENKRHNVRTEDETVRHNKATEEISFGTLSETQRANTARELETIRHNTATEGLDMLKHYENVTHNRASESETERHNITQEQETERHNREQETQTAKYNAESVAASRYATDMGTKAPLIQAGIAQAKMPYDIAKVQAETATAKTSSMRNWAGVIQTAAEADRKQQEIEVHEATAIAEKVAPYVGIVGSIVGMFKH